jgi:hypothetical protein
MNKTIGTVVMISVLGVGGALATGIGMSARQDSGMQNSNSTNSNKAKRNKNKNSNTANANAGDTGGNNNTSP